MTKKLEEEKIKNEYSSDQLNVHNSTHNKGDEIDILMLKFLFFTYTSYAYI